MGENYEILYKKKGYKMTKVLFMVPHEDDELFVGGPMLINLVRDKKYDVYVFISTNGDYYPYEYKERIEESIKVLNTIGVKKENIIFGGYGDCWNGKHIYNSEKSDAKISHAGKSMTYLLDNINEWHYNQYNEHQKYSREGYLNDIINLIKTILPEVIICVDMDSHQDHRCLSLLTDEALGIILKENKSYFPILLKKFAYQGVLFGKMDYFEYPHKRAMNDTDDTCNPYFKWKDRLSYSVPSDCRTKYLHNNFLYKLVKMYKSQEMWMNAGSFINEDIVYWLRNTNNFVLNAQIAATSGQVKYINDFKLIDTDNVLKADCDFHNLCWRPVDNDNKKKIKIKFNKIVQLKHIIIYFNCLGRINGYYLCELHNKNGKTKIIKKFLDNDGFFCDKLDFEETDVMEVIFTFSNLNGKVGIGEIEAFSSNLDIPFKEYKYISSSDNREKRFLIENSLLLLEKLVFKVKRRIYLKTDKWIKERNEYERRSNEGRNYNIT